MLKPNKNLQEAMYTFNQFSIPRAEVVLSRVFLNPGANQKQLFSSEEIKKFQNQMSITEIQLSSIINAFSYVLMYIVAERDFKTVEIVLQQCGLSQGHYTIFINLWQQYGSDYSTRMREQPVAVREVLDSFNWNISLQIEESRLPLKNAANLMNVDGKIDNCDDLFSYDARNPAISFTFTTKQSGDESKKDKFTIKFQKQDLQSLFEELEQIQDNLDMLV